MKKSVLLARLVEWARKLTYNPELEADLFAAAAEIEELMETNLSLALLTERQKREITGLRLAIDALALERGNSYASQKSKVLRRDYARLLDASA